jgi:hypothetical protein
MSSVKLVAYTDMAEQSMLDQYLCSFAIVRLFINLIIDQFFFRFVVFKHLNILILTRITVNDVLRVLAYLRDCISL